MKYTVDSIQNLLNEWYGDKYEVVFYKWSKEPVILKCKIHGEFPLRLDHIKSHLGKELCKECKKEQIRIEKFKKFVEDGKKIHNNKYTYHEDTFIDFSTHTTITCPNHGDFLQTPINHISNKQGCRLCYIDSRKGSYKYSKEEIIKMCKEAHGEKYKYDSIIFQGMKNKLLNIYCPKHGYFNQMAYDHIRGFGCEQCKFENQTMSKEEFIQRATRIHNGFYKYETDKITYVNNHIRIPIICPIHGEFWQRPSYHLMGGGCDECNNSKLEVEITNFLKENKIEYEREKSFDWLGKLRIDFYLPQHNIAIECQGIQHFEEIKHFNSNGCDSLDIRIKRDQRKKQLCEEHDIKLLYYSNLCIEYPYEVFENKEKLLQEIRSTT